MSLRRRLFALVAAALLPLAVMAAVGLLTLKRQQEAQTQEVGLELARSVANAVDAELRSSVAVLETLATTPSLDTADVSVFRDRAQRVLASRPGWVAIVLTDADGRVLMDTAVPDGTPAGPAVTESLAGARRSPAASIGNLVQQPQGGWHFIVRVPVLRDSSLRYFLGALITPDVIRNVLVRQQVPSDWVISIMDANGLRVARSRAHDENLGGRLSESAARVVARGSAEGFGVSSTLEGEQIFTPYSRVASSGWMAVLGLPTAEVASATYQSLAIYGGGIVLSIAFGALVAWWVARTIVTPIAELRVAARALSHGENPQLPHTSIREIREVGTSMQMAARDLAQGEAARETLLRQERLLREAAESADRAKDQFMALLSHELRTPMNAVYGWARMLQAGELRDAAATTRAKNAIVRNADIQIQLIDDLLDLSRITTGKLRLDVRRVDLSVVVAGALDAVRPAADAKMIRLHTNVDADAAAVAGDGARLQQIIWNLLINGVKFTPQGGEVRLHVRRLASFVQIVVSDTGRGITPEMLPHVFERFRQADSSSTRTHGGLGLGLALVKHLVELHGGTVTAQSAGDGLGATFTVTLPVATTDVSPQVAVPALADAHPPPATLPLARLDRVRVLVVDDDAEGLALVDAILARAGAEVRTSASAAAAFDMACTWRPDVLVSDIEMPGEDGYALIRKLRSLGPDRGGAIAAVALTAYGRPQDRGESIAAGFNMHVPKPVDPGELTAIVATVVEQRERLGT